MKKFLIILFALLVIAIIGAGIFLMTLDVDQFRPQIVKQIENAVHKSVQLEKIKLGWQSGIALELQGFALLKRGQPSDKLVEARSAKAVLKLAPLLLRQIHVAAIYLTHPVIRLVKNPDGTFDGWEPEPAQPGEAPGQAAPDSGAAAAISFLINKIRIQDGELFYKDAFGKEPMETHLRKVSVKVDDVALDQPIDFSAQAAVLGPTQNLDLKGELNISSRDFTALLSKFHAELELTPMEFQEIIKVSPAIATSGVIFPIQGALELDMDSLKLDEKGLQEAAAKIRLDRGKVRLKSLKGPIENISVDALKTGAVIKIQKFTAGVAEGKVAGEGTINIKDPLRPTTVFDVKADKLLIEDLVPAPQAGSQLKGSLSLAVRGSLAGQQPDEIMRTLIAEGAVTVERGVITNMNILREVFLKISVIPGLVERLLARLPQNYQKKLREKDTALQTIQVPFSVRNGTVFLPRVSVATDSFWLEGSGTYGLAQGAVAGAALLSIDKDLSMAMIRSVAELQYLTNEKGELQIPLSMNGNVPNVTVMPNVQSVATKVATQKATEVIGGYLEKALGKKQTAQDAGSPSTPSEPGTGTVQSKTGILGELLRQTMGGASTE